MASIITRGPTPEEIGHSLFFDYANELGNEGMTPFTLDGIVTFVVVMAAKRINKHGDWEVECYIPFTDGEHFAARYSTKTRTGEILREWQEKV